jgi:glycosyltransferase involved in cell wall biosynthesis
MRIVFFHDWYSEGMGHTENVIPRVLAARGHEVSVVTSTMQIYGDTTFYNDVYRQFLGPPIVAPGSKVENGVTLIRLPIRLWWKRLHILKGAIRQIVRLKPDIVQTDNPRSLQTLLLSMASRFSSFKLFASEHTVASVYPAYYSFAEWPLHRRLYLWLTEYAWGWIACRRVEKCYGLTPDAAEIAVRFHGVRPSTVRHLPLGMDTQLFFPCRSEADEVERRKIRAELGVGPDEILCIYTGRFTEAKNPHCLAQAIGLLRSNGAPFRALFFGEGEQAAQIASVEGCIVRPFIAFLKLGGFFRAADIGVWPRQESISMLDAAACGIPIVVSDRIKALERVEGNGLTYLENDPADMARQLARLADSQLRKELGEFGAKKMHEQFSAERVADILLADYRTACSD